MAGNLSFDPVMSQLSVVSVRAVSSASVASVSLASIASVKAHPTTTTSSSHKAASTPSPGVAAESTHSTTTTHKATSSKKGSATKSTTSATHSSTKGATQAKHGTSGGVIAAVVIIVLLVAAGAAFFLWRRRRQQNSRQRSGLWLESGSKYAGIFRKGGGGGGGGGGGSNRNIGEISPAKPYMFDGNGSLDPRPFSLPPPAPPPKGQEEKDESDDLLEVPTPHAGASSQTNLLSPVAPSPIHSPRPRTPELPNTPTSASPLVTETASSKVKAALTAAGIDAPNLTPTMPASRPDSGPMLLYSTPRHNNDYYGSGMGSPLGMSSAAGASSSNLAVQPSVNAAEDGANVMAAETSAFNMPQAGGPVMPRPIPVPGFELNDQRHPLASTSSSVPVTPLVAVPPVMPTTPAAFKSVPPSPTSPPPPAYTLTAQPLPQISIQSTTSSPFVPPPPIVINGTTASGSSLASTPSSPMSPLHAAPSPPPVRQQPQPQVPPRKVYAVTRTYVPTLQDELQISVGDRVIVVNEFDDGWAYCERLGDADGAAGVVPLECLDRTRNLALRLETGPRASLMQNRITMAPPSPVGSFASLSTMSERTTAAPSPAPGMNAGGDPLTVAPERLSQRFSSFSVDFSTIGRI